MERLDGSVLMAVAKAFREGVWIIPKGAREQIIVESNCVEGAKSPISLLLGSEIWETNLQVD